MQEVTKYHYHRAEIETADNVKLVSMLFDGAVNFIQLARQKMHKNDIAGRGLYIVKATAIISELNNSLNMDAGGEIAKNLNRLYDYVLDTLLKANMKNDPTALDDAERIVELLRGTWKEMELNRNAAGTAAKTERHSVGMNIRV